jgi:hypothetical protein
MPINTLWADYGASVAVEAATHTAYYDIYATRAAVNALHRG